MTHPAVSSVSSTSARWLGSLAAGPGVLSYIDSYLLLIMGGIPWQVYFQRVLAAKDSRTAKLLSYVAGVGCVIMAVPAALIGAIAASTEWNATDYGQAVVPKEEYGLTLPIVLQFLCPTAVSFVGLGAVSAAVMSSADSSIFSASSMSAKNIYKPLREAVCGPCKKWEVTLVMRFVVILAAAGAVAMAITVKSIYGLFVLCADFVYVILFPQLTCALFVPHTNVIGSAAGYTLGLFFRLSGGDSILGIPALIKYPWYDEADNVQLFPFRTMSMVISLLVNLIISVPARGLLKSKVNGENDLPARQSTQEQNGTDNKGYTDGDKRECLPMS